MYSFKTYLKENTVFADLVFTIYPDSGNDFDTHNLDYKFRKHLEPYKVDISTYNEYEIKFYVRALPAEIYANETKLVEFIKHVMTFFPECKVDDSLQLFFNENEIILCFAELPATKITFPTIGIKSYNGKVSLKGIDKVLDCYSLKIYFPDSIKNGILDILKMKKTLVSIDSITKWPAWYPILIKHMESDRNILKCQRDLIEAGLKDYC